jgi:putative ABC transport system permease protein
VLGRYKNLPVSLQRGKEKRAAAVALRTREIGVRMGLGTKKSDILTLMMPGNLRPVLAGLLAGMVLAARASRLLRGVLYGINTVDPTSFIGASLLFLVIAFATWPSSRRPTRVDPMVALRGAKPTSMENIQYCA